MDKQFIGRKLKEKLSEGYDVVNISRWAFHIFSNTRSLDSELRDILEQLFSMEDDPQFELTAEELTELAEKLIAEGERDTLGNPIPEIEEIAQSLGDNWFMCPICQEAWEDFSKYGMVRCPKCNNVLHNPKYNGSSEINVP